MDLPLAGGVSPRQQRGAFRQPHRTGHSRCCTLIGASILYSCCVGERHSLEAEQAFMADVTTQDDSFAHEHKVPSTNTAAGRLIAQSMATMPADLFAIVDGALFDNLPALMSRYRLRGRALFLEGGDADTVRSGPFLVPLDSDPQITATIAIIDHGRMPVIWSWQYGEPALYRHLRKQNLVEIPKDPVQSDVADASANGQHESVIYRHWDPSVLAMTLPVLTPAQRARFQGLAFGLVFDASASHGRHVVGPVSSPGPAESRLIRLSAEQIDQIEDLSAGDDLRQVTDEVESMLGPSSASPERKEIVRCVREANRTADRLGCERLDSVTVIALWLLLFGRDSEEYRNLILAASQWDGMPDDHVERHAKVTCAALAERLGV